MTWDNSDGAFTFSRESHISRNVFPFHSPMVHGVSSASVCKTDSLHLRSPGSPNRSGSVVFCFICMLHILRQKKAFLELGLG